MKCLPATLFGFALALSAVSASAAPVTHAVHKTPVWAKYDSKTKTARLRVIAAYNGAANGYNFDGGANGALTFTVPLGAKVIVKFTNRSDMMPHAAEVVKYTGALPTGATPPSPAFAGAATPDYAHGEQPGTTVSFSFTASTAGKYLLICPVHNHVKFGHWAWFIVSRKAKTAKALLKS